MMERPYYMDYSPARMVAHKVEFATWNYNSPVGSVVASDYEKTNYPTNY